MTNRIGPTRVAKKIAPGQPGALKWARQYGAALVCVRYRVEDGGQRRYTTVELVVDEAPTQAGADAARVAVRVDFEETDLRQRVKDAGATWDRDARVWHMTRRQAKALGLLPRVVPE